MLQGKIEVRSEPIEQVMSTGERTIRLALLTGFLAVLAVEAWLLLQAFQTWL